MTPFGLLFNHEHRSIDGDIIQGDILTGHLQEDVNERRQKAIMRIGDDQAKQRKRYNKKRAEAKDYQPGDLVLVRREAPSTGEQRKRYNKKRAEAKDYQPGDLVLVRREAPSTGESRKLQEKYKGPYVIVEKLPHDRYRIEDMPESRKLQEKYKGPYVILEKLPHDRYRIEDMPDTQRSQKF
ncbi:hypothetical protein QE152_g11081 [Popillia japonica]|uniref:Uncharacterized protein n=1 Tax=Popillia japonica TaxID=7064 RepID=A0AAW1LT57_POPJA